MLVMKFGGTSMGSAERMNSSLAIIAQRAQDNRVCVVVSAVGGVSNRLQAAIDEAMRTKDEQSADVASLVEPFVSIHNTIIDELSRFAPGFRPDVVHQAIEPLFDEYSRLLTAVNAFGECPQSIECRIMGLGERACIPIMAELSHTRFPAVTVLDS
ncbi:MAG TPA: bifunctional aspartate kinase/homoserine dehydrogenase I, partial [Treponemataceae bacterium]|nr:bifunctional aspartate kinase/homoserine dehydrogenase I [Treponemataceae bacterium]